MAYKLSIQSQNKNSEIQLAQLPFSLTNIRSGDRFGFRINKPGWIEMIKNGKSYPPIPLKLSNRISIGIEFEVTSEDEVSISGRVRNIFMKNSFFHFLKISKPFFSGAKMAN